MPITQEKLHGIRLDGVIELSCPQGEFEERFKELRSLAYSIVRPRVL
jgi:hypothetical protein